MVLPEPNKEMELLAEAVKVPFTVRFPAITHEESVVMLAAGLEVIIRSSSVMLEPEILFPDPVMVNVPAPPVVCVKEPAPEVEKLPHKVTDVAALSVVPLPVITKLPKLFEPLPLQTEDEPDEVRVPIVPPHPLLNDPLLVQLPPSK